MKPSITPDVIGRKLMMVKQASHAYLSKTPLQRLWNFNTAKVKDISRNEHNVLPAQASPISPSLERQCGDIVKAFSKS